MGISSFHFISFSREKKLYCKTNFLHKSIEINQIKVTLLRALVLYSLLVRVGTHAQDLERNTICLSQISPASLPLPTYSAVEYYKFKTDTASLLFMNFMKVEKTGLCLRLE